jgi:SAM-dependent methyltransferase
MQPSDVPTSETLGFVRGHLGAGRARILEVGCGDGALAARLQELGHEVVGIDSALEVVTRARERGVDARAATWPDFDEAPFDAILFTRSLHHIRPLPRAVARAKELLKPRGKVLVEDFAFSEIEPLAVEWLYGLLKLLDAGSLLVWEHDSFGDHLFRAEDKFEAWKAGHDHDIHSAAAMEANLRAHFGGVETLTAPYLYRYVCALLEGAEGGYRVASRLVEIEQRFTDAAGLRPLGRRFVGRKGA